MSDDLTIPFFGSATVETPHADYGTAKQPVITCAGAVESKPVAWLWERHVPLGALTLLDGHPDTGKSTITLDLAARVSRGARMPDGSQGILGGVLLCNTEDTLATPVRGRLEASGADLAQCHGLEVLEEGGFPRTLSFPEDVEVLREAIIRVNARLVVIDPIMGHLSSTLSANQDQEVRRALTPLARVAAASGASVLMVRHLRKPDRKSAAPPSWLEGGGSSGGFGIVRAGMAVVQNDDSPYKTLHVVKHNYGEWSRPIDYMIETESHGLGKIVWYPR